MKIILIIFLGFSIYTCSAQTKRANKGVLGIKAGAALSQLTGDGFKGFSKYGFTGGLSLQIKLNKKWTGNVETLFIQKGVSHDGNSRQNYYDLYQVNFYYLEVPVIFSYHYKKCAFGFGPGAGLLIHQHEVDYSKNLNSHNSFNNRDISFNFDLKLFLNDKTVIDLRYTNSILPIRNNPSGKNKWYNPGQQNQAFVLSLNYLFIRTISKANIF